MLSIPCSLHCQDSPHSFERNFPEIAHTSFHSYPIAKTETCGCTLLQGRLGNVVFIPDKIMLHKNHFTLEERLDMGEQLIVLCSASSGIHGNPSYTACILSQSSWNSLAWCLQEVTASFPDFQDPLRQVTLHQMGKLGHCKPFVKAPLPLCAISSLSFLLYHIMYNLRGIRSNQNTANFDPEDLDLNLG